MSTLWSKVKNAPGFRMFPLDSRIDCFVYYSHGIPGFIYELSKNKMIKVTHSRVAFLLFSEESSHMFEVVLVDLVINAQKKGQKPS